MALPDLDFLLFFEQGFVVFGVVRSVHFYSFSFFRYFSPLLFPLILLVWEMKNPFKQLNLFKFKEKKNILTIAEQKELELRKEKIEKAIRSRAYISEINQRYNKMTDKKRKNFFRRAA